MVKITKRRLLSVLGVGIGGYFYLTGQDRDQDQNDEDRQLPYTGESLEFTGDGALVETISIEGRGPSILTFEYSGEGGYMLYVYDPSLSVVDVIEGGASETRRMILPTTPGEYEIRVRDTEGSWRLIVEDHGEHSESDSILTTPPLSYEGDSIEVIGPINFNPEIKTQFEIMFEQSSGVHKLKLYDPNGWLSSEIGEFDLDEADSSRVSVSDYIGGVGYLLIESDGSWEIDVDEVEDSLTGEV